MTTELDAVIVGAGFSGLYALHELRARGLKTRVLERGDGVGGTWFYNRYPGARCDIESIDYAYSFSDELVREWRWTERYATQPEILHYLDHVADRFDLRRDIVFETLVTRAEYDAAAHRWIVSTEDGTCFRARFCVMAVGCLSSIKTPEIPGLDRFRGEWLHTARWPRDGVDLDGRRVGIVGTGSTGIQAIPRLAEQASRLFVFQRTPNYSMPARNRAIDADTRGDLLSDFDERRELARNSDAGVPIAPPRHATFDVSEPERRRMYQAGWDRGGINALSYAFSDFFTSEAGNAEAQEFTRERIRALVDDPAVAEALCPRHHIGTKRTCVDIGYYETYNRDNVELVDLRTTPIVEITERGIQTTTREYALDCLVFAIGFDAITGALLDIDIRGLGGEALAERWADGPRTYLGLAVAGLPNLFLVTGPGSPSVLSNMVVSIEQHVDWIVEAITHVDRTGAVSIEATREAEDAWVRHVEKLGRATLYPQASSWYVGANVPGKPRVFMPYVAGCGVYRQECDEVVRQDYAGFRFSRATVPQRGAGRAA